MRFIYKKISHNLKTESANYVNKLNTLTKKNARSLEKYLTNGYFRCKHNSTYLSF